MPKNNTNQAPKSPEEEVRTDNSSSTEIEGARSGFSAGISSAIDSFLKETSDIPEHNESIFGSRQKTDH